MRDAIPATFAIPAGFMPPVSPARSAGTKPHFASWASFGPPSSLSGFPIATENPKFLVKPTQELVSFVEGKSSSQWLESYLHVQLSKKFQTTSQIRMLKGSHTESGQQSYDVFISYCSADYDFAASLYAKLSGHGFNAWFDRARLNPGFNWHQEIESACESSRIVLPLLTPSWQESEWCRFETYGAECIIPILLAGEWPQAAPSPLRAYQYLDFRGQETRDWDKLLACIRSYLQEPAPHKSPRLASLPYAANPCFVGRERTLLEIHEILSPPPVPTLTQAFPVAINGIGGVGKTTVAREYAEKFWRIYLDIFWIRADPALLVSEFARLALELHLVRQPARDVREDAERALRELRTGRSRLLVFDNAIDEESIQHWIPSVGGCRTLITTRFANWSPKVRTVGVAVLSPSQAQDFLWRRSEANPTESNSQGINQLTTELGYLPLALEQAAAFVRKHRLGFEKYLNFYKESRRQLLSEHVLGSTQYPDSVATTWWTTLKRVSDSARKLLRFISFLAPDEITIRMLEEACQPWDDTFRARISARLRIPFALFTPRRAKPLLSVGCSEFGIRIILGELADYSMISQRNDTLSVHRLVQAVQIERLSKRKQKKYSRRAVLLMYRVFPSPNFDNFRLCACLLPHAKSACNLASRWQFQFAAAALLANTVGIYLQTVGRYSQAESLFHYELNVYSRSPLREIDPDYATCLNNLATFYLECGNSKAAEPLFHHALKIRERVFGPINSMTADSLGALGSLSMQTGNYFAAEQFYTRARQILRVTVGEASPDYAKALSNLATFYGSQCDYAKAVTLMRESLIILRQAYGEMHPVYSQCLSNLAVYCYRLGDYLEAEQHYLRALQLREAALGTDHPELAYILTNLGVLYRVMRKYPDAEALFQRALNLRRAALGEENPKYAQTLTELAALYNEQNRLADAEALHLRSIEILRAAAEDAHPIMVRVLKNYAVFLQGAGHPSKAKRIEADAEELDQLHGKHRIELS